MRRREFIEWLGGAALSPLCAAHAEQAGAMRRVAVLTAYLEGDPEARRRIAAFTDALRALGWTPGYNVQIDYRWAAGKSERIRSFAVELLASRPDVVLAAGETAVDSIRRQDPTVPVVFVQIDDPVSAGLVANASHPSGNMTGFTPFEFSMTGKMLGLLKDIAPQISEVGIVLNPDSTTHAGALHAVREVAPTVGVQVTSIAVRNAEDIERALNVFTAAPNRGLIVLSYTLANVNRRMIIQQLARTHVPAVYPFPHYVADGGLMSYGIDPVDQYHDAASYVSRILSGESADDLPVQGPTKFKFVINLTTAKALGLDVPPILQASADEVIE
jgi:putative ABC transport system substrate-binding protein